MAGSFLRRGFFIAAAIIGVFLAVIALYLLRVLVGTRTSVASYDGTRTRMPVSAPVTIARDGRGVPHVRAGSVHDLFVAEGYAMGSDRLFQMDVTRRFVEGRLAEVLGSPVVRVDRRMRRYAIRDLAARVYARSSPEERDLLDAFAAGINAAASQEPAPVEYGALFTRFEPWKPEDSLAVGFATVLDLDDRPDDVVTRDRILREVGRPLAEALYPLTDPKYDVPTNGQPPGPISALPELGPPAPHVTLSHHATLSHDVTLRHSKRDRELAIILREPQDDRGARQDDRGAPQDDIGAPPDDIGAPPDEKVVGSNAFVVGADRARDGRAMLANDPHLDIAIPGIWYLFEGSAPGLHIAGAALAGTPGVTLGHNEHLAWGVTAGETAAMRVVYEMSLGDQLYEHHTWVRARHRHETIRVRFGSAVDADILETPHGVVIARDGDGRGAYLMDWRMQRDPVSPLSPFLHLLHARTVTEGIAAMRALPEPALNVVFADDTGRVAYHFAGGVPLEPSWGRWADDADAPEPPNLAYDRSPHIDPSRAALVVTSNNRPDGTGAPRLAPFWPPPYRAFQIRRTLQNASRGAKLSFDDLARAQDDVRSPAELEFALLVLRAAERTHAVQRDASLGPLVSALQSFHGEMTPDSRGAAAVVALRRMMLGSLAAAHLSPALAGAYPGTSPGFEIVLRALRERPRGWVARDDYDAFVEQSLRVVSHDFNGQGPPTFGEYAAQPLLHNLAAFGFKLWNGPTMPGRGGTFAPAVQWNGHAQSFRAIWIAGDWDHGTIDIAAGESGEPGSPHYADQNAKWLQRGRTPLPFSDAAVRAATTSTLTLKP